jgi:hypothetical protein
MRRGLPDTGPSPVHQIWDDDDNATHERGSPPIQQSSNDDLDEEAEGQASVEVTAI